jgi:hypothetical protein
MVWFDATYKLYLSLTPRFVQARWRLDTGGGSLAASALGGSNHGRAPQSGNGLVRLRVDGSLADVGRARSAAGAGVPAATRRSCQTRRSSHSQEARRQEEGQEGRGSWREEGGQADPRAGCEAGREAGREASRAPRGDPAIDTARRQEERAAYGPAERQEERAARTAAPLVPTHARAPRLRRGASSFPRIAPPPRCEPAPPRS